MIFCATVGTDGEMGSVNPDYAHTRDDAAARESRLGRAPEAAFAALRTGWPKRRPDDAKLAKDSAGVFRHPEFAARLLAVEP
jgi:kynurenine formamidase